MFMECPLSHVFEVCQTLWTHTQNITNGTDGGEHTHGNIYKQVRHHSYPFVTGDQFEEIKFMKNKVK